MTLFRAAPVPASEPEPRIAPVARVRCGNGGRTPRTLTGHGHTTCAAPATVQPAYTTRRAQPWPWSGRVARAGRPAPEYRRLARAGRTPGAPVLSPPS